MNRDARLAELREWLSHFDGLADAEPVPASVDASFRRYFRVQGRTSLIAMDAPPPMEDCGPFVTIAGYLREMGINAPQVLECDMSRGFLLMTDLGSTQYLTALDRGSPPADRLYADALASLVRLQREGIRFQSRLPPYDEKTLRFEMSLFHDWLCVRHLDLEFAPSELAVWQACCDLLVDDALAQPQVFVHRDYHSRNLMVTGTDNPGVLDFQDALEGPLAYDSVSLLKDCYVRWPAEVTRRRALAYFRELPADVSGGIDGEEYLRHFHLTGVQRHLKAAGIFARLWHRDGKPGYLKDVPRTLGYVVEAADFVTELGDFADLVGRRVLPALEQSA